MIQFPQEHTPAHLYRLHSFTVSQCFHRSDCIFIDFFSHGRDTSQEKFRNDSNGNANEHFLRFNRGK